MATSIRNKFIKSTAFKIILWFTVLSLAGVFSLSEVIRFAFSRPTWVVAVNGQKMYLQDLTRKINYQEQLVDAIRQQYGNYSDVILQMMGLTGSLEERALEQLIGETVLNQSAEKLSLTISPDYITTKLLEPSFLYRHTDIIPPYLIDATGGINMRGLNIYLQRMNLSLSDIQRAIAMTIKRDFLVNTVPEISSLVELSAYTPTFAIKDQYHQEHAAKKFSVLTFNFDTFLKKAKSEPVKENELQLFFDERVAQKNYWVPEKRSGLMWRFDPSNYGIAVSQNEIASYYDAHKSKEFIESPAKLEIRKIVINRTKEDAQKVSEKAEQIHAQLMQDPSQFATLAEKVSDDKETASQGGLLAPFSRGTYDREFEKAAFSIKNDGDISPLIKNDDEFIIIQRIAKHPQKLKPLASVDKDIRTKLIQKKFNQEFIADMQKNAELFEQKNEQAATFFKKKKTQEEKLDKVTKDSSRAAQALFAGTKGAYNFYLDGDIGVVVVLNDIHKQYLPSLEAIRATVEEDFYAQRAAQMLEKTIAQARVDAQSKSLEELSTMYDAPIKVIDFVSAQDSDSLKQMTQQGTPIKEMIKIEKPHLIFALVEGRNGFLVRLDEIKPLNDQEFVAQYDTVSSKAKQATAQHVIAGFVASLHRNATIKTNESVINA